MLKRAAVFVAHGVCAMGASRTKSRCYLFFCVLVCCACCAKTQAQNLCTPDEACHFGSCAKKDFAFSNVTHNLTSISCNHPYVKAVLTFAFPADSNIETIEAIATRCGGLARARPCCETRLPKTVLDTSLIFFSFAVAAFFCISKDF